MSKTDNTQTPLLVLHGEVLLPGAVRPIEVSDPGERNLLQDLARQQPRRILLGARDDKDALFPVVVEGEVLQVIAIGPDRYRALVRAESRRQLGSVDESGDYLRASHDDFVETHAESSEIAELTEEVRKSSRALVKQASGLGDDAADLVDDLVRTPGKLADLAAANLPLKRDEQLALLVEPSVKVRLERVAAALVYQLRVVHVQKEIDEDVRENLGRQQREAILRARMRAIQEELGEGDEGREDIDALRKKLDEGKLPADADAVARKQLRRLQGMQPGSAEYPMTRNYVELLAELPWEKRSEDKLDVEAARAVLDADHHGLTKVKKRILEYLAVRKLKGHKSRSPILCLAGPPGVGKTSLGKSIARALGREFVRLSLGGVRDEAEIRGHRRTYIGALPGRIIQSMKRAGTKNPVLFLDELDKLGSDFHGDPAAALLEVLDPEQNWSFSDHYLEVPFDLSEVIFIVTANDLSQIPPALRDRLEILTLSGYPIGDKREIARRHIVPRQIAEHGLDGKGIDFSDEALDEIIEGYTREAGVRTLERQVATIVRALAVKVASDEALPTEVRASEVLEVLGPPRFLREIGEATAEPGVSTGLAWTESGGEILFVEVGRMPGHGQLVLTGQLGDVMKESAQAALSWVRAHAGTLGIEDGLFGKSDLHVHVPAGAVPKDGPSAGNALVSALVSQLSGRPVRGDVAMTGEITLRGAVLPVGGIAEKVLAAHRAGMKRVILPARNAKDLAEVPAEARDALDFVLVDRIEQTLEAALEAAPLSPALLGDPPALPSVLAA